MTNKAYGSAKLDSRKCTRDEKVVKMERFLALWINRKERESGSLDKCVIKEQAMCFYKVISRKSNSPLGKFKASMGWLCRFLEHKELRNLKFTGESASADVDAANNFPSFL